MNESLVKYLAGLLDADGSLSFTFKHDQNREGRYFVGLSLRLASSAAADPGGFIETLPAETGMGSVGRYGAADQFKTWAVSRRADLEMLLPRLTKHMVIKAAHWQWLLEQWRDLRAEAKTVSADERAALTEASKQSRKTRVGPLRAKNYPTWAWLAGYLDGDGWYSYRRHYAKTTGHHQWSIRVGAVAHVNDMGVLQFLERSFGGSIRDHNESGSVKVWNRSLGYQNRDFALRFLPKLAKHARLKRHKIDAIIHHHRQRLSVPGTEKRYCTADDCGKPAHGFGLCHKHYMRQRKQVQATV
jgi:hypothetical protein